MPITATGYMSSGEATFDGAFVTIRRRGVAARASYGRGDTRLPVDQITEVKFKPAGRLVNGFILFVTAGMLIPNYKAGEQMKKLAHLPTAVIFTRKGQDEFETLRQVVEAAIAERLSSTRSIPTTTSAADELAKLAQLRDRGILTETEFATRKAQILGL